VEQPKQIISMPAIVQQLSLIFIFCCIMLLPIATINTQTHISSTENRVLADFPQMIIEGRFNTRFGSEFISFLSDNIGFREQLNKLWSIIEVKAFTSPSGPVHIGRNGWYYFTLNDNIDIAKGTYPLTEGTLQNLAARQQRISDWYKIRGIEYFYILTPSKASIYPEYISGGDFKVGTSPVDVAVEYLNNHSDVKVMSTKTALLEAKNNGIQVFRQTDSHFSPYGAYVATEAVADFIGVSGFPDVSYTSNSTFRGEFNNNLGNPDLLGIETIQQPNVDMRDITVINEQNAEKCGDYYAQLKKLEMEYNPNRPYFWMQENPKAQNGTVLIYGDSNVEAGFLTYLFASFQRVVSIPMSSLMPPSLEIEAFLKPDIVIRDNGERLINIEADLWQDTPDTVNQSAIDELPDVARVSADFSALTWDCFWLDAPVNDNVSATIPSDNGVIELNGTAFDPMTRQPLQALYVKGKSGKLIEVENRFIENPYPRELFQNDSLPVNISFSQKIIIDELDNPDEIVFIRIGTFGGRLSDKKFTVIYQ
jgi:hypothetical protein